jgi:hypothetical protein
MCERCWSQQARDPLSQLYHLALRIEHALEQTCIFGGEILQYRLYTPSAIRLRYSPFIEKATSLGDHWPRQLRLGPEWA